MAVNEKWWDGATKEEMQDPILNYAVGIDLVKKSEEVVSAANDSPSIAQIASNYNNENAVTVVTDYGERVEGFYQWFKSRDE
ncbi:hypothetical protein MASR2M78_22400 [Treponema sp.]